MTTWALVVFLQMSWAGGATTIDGFQSKADCEAAALIFHEKAGFWDSRQLPDAVTYCIEIPSGEAMRQNATQD